MPIPPDPVGEDEENGEDRRTSHGGERFVRDDDGRGDLGVLAADAAHPFDQTNGIIEGLEGDADDPDKVDERLSGTPAGGAAFPVAPGVDLRPERHEDES